MKRLLFAIIVSGTLAGAQQTVSSVPPGVAGNSASLQGSVSDAGGHPIRKAGLTLRSAYQPGNQQNHVYNAATDADGKFFFDGLAPGSYALSAELAGYLQKMYRASPHETFSAIPLAAGQSLTDIHLVLSRALAIAGRVLDEDGDPVAAAPVRILQRTLQSTNLMVQHTVYTDEFGQYNLPDLSPGEYYLSAGDASRGALSILGMKVSAGPAPGSSGGRGEQPRFYAETFYPNSIDQSGAKPLQLLHDDLPGIDIHLRRTRAFAVKGKLVGTVPGHPLEQLQVLLTPANLPSIRSPMAQGTYGRMAKDGSFEFTDLRFPPGAYFLTVLHPSDRRLMLAPQRLMIGDSEIDDAVLNLQPLVTLQGRLTLEGDRPTDFSVFPQSPPPSVTMRVSLTPVNGPTLYSSSGGVANDGAFTIADVAPGAYQVRTSGIPGSAWVRSIRFGSEQAAGSEIQVTAASASAPLQITLSRSVGQIDGVVRTQDGKPASGSTVILIGELPMGLTGVNQNGEFTLPSVQPGTYRIYAFEDIEAAQRYDPALLKAHEAMSALVTVKENGRERMTLTEIPFEPER